MRYSHSVYVGGELRLLRRKGSPWILARLRKATRCVECRVELPVNTRAWRPVDNSAQRPDRLCRMCAEHLARRAGTE